MTTQERIKQEAAKALEEAEGSNINLWPIPANDEDRGYWLQIFEAGALSERNKVIEEVKARLLDKGFEPDDHNGNIIFKLLESLKV